MVAVVSMQPGSRLVYTLLCFERLMNPLNIFAQEQPQPTVVQAMPIAVPPSLKKWYAATMAVLRTQQDESLYATYVP